MTPNLQKIETLVRQLLVELGEDPAREGLVKTPLRVAQALSFLTNGYRANVKQVINNALFTQDTGGMVIVKDIELRMHAEAEQFSAESDAQRAALAKIRSDIERTLAEALALSTNELDVHAAERRRAASRARLLEHAVHLWRRRGVAAAVADRVADGSAA